MIIIDGHKWRVPCDITRTAEVTPSEISGIMLDKTYFNDVIGTFLTYDVSLAVPPSMEHSYDALYEVLTDPVDGHRFVMPYGQGAIEITARVESVKDTLVYTASKRQYWKGIRFTAIANHPSTTYDLETVIRTGRAPMPSTMEVEDGSVWIYSDGLWDEYDPKLGSKTVTEVGTYSAEDDDLNGYSTVIVSIPDGDSMRF